MAAKVRPGVSEAVRLPKKKSAAEHYSLRAVNAVLDAIEFDDKGLDHAMGQLPKDESGRYRNTALARWIEHAVRNYLSAALAISTAGPALEPRSRDWVRLETGNRVREECATGRRYANETMRELRILRIRSVRERDRNEGEIAFAAAVLADGQDVLGGGWDRPSVLKSPVEVERVRVVEIGCADGSHRVVFDGTPALARERYLEEAAERVESVISGEGDHVPGADCAGCKLLTVCPAVAVRPGLLGIKDDSRRRRSWSMSTGRTHLDCARKEYLYNLKLPKDDQVEYNQAARRGQAVHSWIESRHSRRPVQACESGEVPSSTESWRAGSWQIAGKHARLGVQMIGDHAFTCPFAGRPDDAEAYPEHVVVVHDPDADVVVIAKVDLLYRIGDRWALRETKTTSSTDEYDLLNRYPQLALAMVLAAEAVLPTGCQVELERLTPAGPLVVEFDPADEDLLLEARQIVHKHAVSWHADELFPARPGKQCRTCSVSRWCPDAKVEGSP